jgi:hypothetical protein
MFPGQGDLRGHALSEFGAGQPGCRLRAPLHGVESHSDPGLQPCSSRLQVFQLPELVDQAGAIGTGANGGQRPEQVRDRGVIATRGCGSDSRTCFRPLSAVHS